MVMARNRQKAGSFVMDKTMVRAMALAGVDPYVDERCVDCRQLDHIPHLPWCDYLKTRMAIDNPYWSDEANDWADAHPEVRPKGAAKRWRKHRIQPEETPHAVDIS